MKTSIHNKGICLLTCVLFLSFFVKAQLLDSTRLPGIEVKTFQSKILGEKRKIRIQVPAGTNTYDAYPVLYVLDGESQTGMVAGQVQYLSKSYKIIPNIIVVGIDNTDRTRDLTPTHSIIGPDGKADTSANAFGKNSGGGENFLKFIKEELMPYVEERYHPAPYTILVGHSLGGLMAVHCLLNHPDYFNAYIAISPSLQWDNRFTLLQAGQNINNKALHNKRLFFSDANEDAAFHENQLALDSVLAKSQELKYKRMFYPEETHVSEPVKAFYDGIRFIYPSWHLPYNSSAFRKTMTSTIIKKHFEELSKAYGYKIIPLHDELNAIARFLRNDPARIADGIELLQMNASNYPNSAIIQETLGDTYLKINDTKNALIFYQKALQNNPSNEELKQKIAKLN